MDLNRRQFLKASGLSAAATALVLFADEGAVMAEGLKDLRIARAKQVPSICPHCSVGCGMIAYVKEGELLQLEGNPDHPINEGSLCPKGAASFQFAYEARGKANPRRLLKAKYRKPYGTEWEEISLDEALDRIAERVKATRDQYFIEKNNGMTVNRLEAIAHLGSATIDNEENYLLTKLMRSLGVVYLEHHARI